MRRIRCANSRDPSPRKPRVESDVCVVLCANALPGRTLELRAGKYVGRWDMEMESIVCMRAHRRNT